jgi:hypothetical protein
MTILYLPSTALVLANMLALGVSICLADDSPKGKPNILVIVADDMR